MSGKRFAVIGGDMRTVYLARSLAEKGYEVRTYGLEREDPGREEACVGEALRGADYVVLPFPCSRDGEWLNTPLSDRKLRISDLAPLVPPDSVVFGGGIPASFSMETLAQVHDCLELEQVLIPNAVATAEGAVLLAMQSRPCTVSGSRCLIVGYGRIGKALAPRLRALGAEVTVSARKASDIAWIGAGGMCGVNTCRIWESMDRYDIVFNTVPYPVIGRRELERAGKTAVFIELASKPGGIDLSVAEQLGLKAVPAPGLPGKMCPKTAGQIIEKAILDIISEKN